MYNKSEVMKEAWKLYRGLSRNLRGKIMGTFAGCLRTAWARAKKVATQTKQSAEESLFLLQMKDHWSPEDYEDADRLERIIRAAA